MNSRGPIWTYVNTDNARKFNEELSKNMPKEWETNPYYEYSNMEELHEDSRLTKYIDTSIDYTGELAL